MGASIPQTNPNAQTVLTTLGYTPIATNIGGDFANVQPSTMRCIKVGEFVRLLGHVQFDVTAPALGQAICDLSLPAIDGIVDAEGLGVTVNAAEVGGAPGSGVCSVILVGGKMRVQLDEQAFVGAGYNVMLDVVLTVQNADNA